MDKLTFNVVINKKSGHDVLVNNRIVYVNSINQGTNNPVVICNAVSVNGVIE